MIDNRLIKSFDTACLKKVQGSSYAYAPFMNLKTLSACDIDVSDMSDKIIIFDTETHFFNISTLVKAFGSSKNRQTAGSYTKTAAYKNLIEFYTKELTNLPESERKAYYETKAYNKELNLIKASFIERRTNYSPNCSGIFVHPALVLNALVWCNDKIAYELNTYITSLLLQQGSNETKQISKLVDNTVEELVTDVEARNEYILDMQTNTENKDARFNKYVLYDRLHATASKYSMYRPKDLTKKLQKCVSKQLVLVRHYDEDEYVYDPEYDDSYPVLFEIKVITPSELQQTLNDNTVKIVINKLGETTFTKTAIPISTPLVSTFPYNNSNVNDEFVKLYGDVIDMELTDAGLISSFNITKIKDTILDFTLDYIAQDLL